MTAQYTSDEMMTITASRALNNNSTCFVGIGLPSAAANLARLTHAPGITLIYESGTIETKPQILPLSIGDGELCESALTTVAVPEMFRYWLQGGHIDVGFLGTAQVDRYGNINTTVIAASHNPEGPDGAHCYANPRVRLPGGGGAPEAIVPDKGADDNANHGAANGERNGGAPCGRGGRRYRRSRGRLDWSSQLVRCDFLRNIVENGVVIVRGKFGALGHFH